MEKSLSQVGFRLLLGLVVGFILSGFLCWSEPVWVAAETQQEQTVAYTIAFSSLAPWDLDVFIADADGSNPKPLASHPDLDYNAAFSPDGKLVVFHRHTNRPVPSVRERSSLVPGVRLLRINGAFPSFSPAGDTLSFTDNFRSIERMKIDGSDHRQVYKDTRSLRSVRRWHPRLGSAATPASGTLGNLL